MQHTRKATPENPQRPHSPSAYGPVHAQLARNRPERRDGRGRLKAGTSGTPIPKKNLWLPDVDEPGEYDGRVRQLEVWTVIAQAATEDVYVTRPRRLRIKCIMYARFQRGLPAKRQGQGSGRSPLTTTVTVREMLAHGRRTWQWEPDRVGASRGWPEDLSWRCRCGRGSARMDRQEDVLPLRGLLPVLVVWDGEARADVVVSPDADEQAHHAVDVLVEYVERATGAVFPVVDTDNGDGRTNLYVGHLPDGTDLPQETLPGLPDDGFVIHQQHKTIAIVGPSSWGTRYGVYEFLERYVDVRWLTADAWPGFPDLVGNDVPETSKILVWCPETKVEQPAARSGVGAVEVCAAVVRPDLEPSVGDKRLVHGEDRRPHGRRSHTAVPDSEQPVRVAALDLLFVGCVERVAFGDFHQPAGGLLQH